MSRKRFHNLEGPAYLPKQVQSAVERLNRFQNIEIGDNQPARLPRISAAQSRSLCPHCGQKNEKNRENCWACHRSLHLNADRTKQADHSEVSEIVLDGKNYRYDDPHLPEDIRVLFEWIRDRGYSQKLLVEWRNWRVSRNSGKFKKKSAGATRENAPAAPENFVSIALDGHEYRSNDPHMPDDIRSLLIYIQKHGITPPLMELLRQSIKRVKYRPATTADPSDGDLAFWKTLGKKS